MFKKIFLSILILFPSLAMASELPFTDVAPSASYYADLKHMYDAKVIGDTPDHLFRPDGLLNRDEFVAIAVGVSCQKCIYPSIEDVLHYNTNPFVDILKSNRYFYCIAYAKEKEIVRGYVLDSTGRVQCQNRAETFTEVPFCPVNSITRIEAAAVLLRQAGLWSESKNSSAFVKTVVIGDLKGDDYWFGYAQKALEIGLIKMNADKKVFPDEYITRKEFVAMASKIFNINMCQVKNNTTPSDFASVIKIYDKERTPNAPSQIVTTFPNNKETTYDFGGYATGALNPPFQYDWTFTNITTGEVKTATGSYLDNFNLGSSGIWIVKLVITDASSHTSTAYQQIFVKDGTVPTANNPNNPSNTSGTGISVQIGIIDNKNPGNPNNNPNNNPSNPNNNAKGGTDPNDPLNTGARALHGIVGVPMPFFSIPTGGDGRYSFEWNFGDSGSSTLKDPTHTYVKEGVYPVTLIVRDTSGNVAHAQLTVIVSKNPDRDGDGVLDYNDDGSIRDVCPDVKGPASNKGCPIVNEYSKDKTVVGIPIDTGGNPWNNNPLNNLCLSKKVQSSGIIEGTVQCSSCPCIYKSEFLARIRGCDIIFPSITSPDKKTLYSRGGIFPVP